MNYTWQARYNDGTTLNQVKGDEKNAYADIDRSKLVAFHLLDETHKYIATVMFDDDGEKLVWTRRVFNRANQLETFHILGKKGEFIMAVTDDGQVIVRHNFKDDGLFDEVVCG